MSKTEVVCWLSHFGFYTKKSVFNNIAFQQWWQHHLTVPFLTCRKNPSCICEEFDTCVAGKENIWLFLFLEHVGCLVKMFLLLPLLLWQHHVRSLKLNMVWFPCTFADTLLLILPYWHLHNFLVVGEELIFMRKYFGYQNNSWCFFGSFCHDIKTNFIFEVYKVCN